MIPFSWLFPGLHHLSLVQVCMHQSGCFEEGVCVQHTVFMIGYQLFITIVLHRHDTWRQHAIVRNVYMHACMDIRFSILHISDAVVTNEGRTMVLQQDYEY